jgi:hypothetical protein
MKPIAYFYHCRLEGGDPPIDFDHAFTLMKEQMDEVYRSGLNDATSKRFIGVNGGDINLFGASHLAPSGSVTHGYDENMRGELPTLRILHDWAKENPSWNVLYFHSKGATHRGDEFYANWRRCMMRHLVTDWEKCVRDLNQVESVGCHWLTPERWGSSVKTPFWGGNFWWARSEFIATLPVEKISAECRDDFYLAESWIGRGPRRPSIIDYHPNWPNPQECR